VTKGNKRLHGEKQAAYKNRLKDEKERIKRWLRGRWIWRVGSGGTYVRALHGEIGSRAK